MCLSAIRFSRFEFSDEEIRRVGLSLSGNEVLVRVFDKVSYLPVLDNGNMVLIKWGMQIQPSRGKMAFCKMESLGEGKWQWLNPKKIVVVASFAFANGVWFQVRQGLSAVLTENYKGEKTVFVLTQPSTHYFEIMTGSKRMPVLINQIL